VYQLLRRRQYLDLSPFLLPGDDAANVLVPMDIEIEDAGVGLVDEEVALLALDASGTLGRLNPGRAAAFHVGSQHSGGVPIERAKGQPAAGNRWQP
jgi:hypothetical protein